MAFFTVFNQFQSKTALNLLDETLHNCYKVCDIKDGMNTL